jgi:3-deoxy-D-manno-octulosonic-acid transferase
MAEPSGAALIALWQGVGRLAMPLLPALLAHRRRLGKEDPARWPERLGRASLARPDGPLVWLHAASVGETIAAIALVRRLAKRGANLLLTTGTVTSAEIAAARLAGLVLHQYAPLDAGPAVARFLAHWQPDLALTVESELWPAKVAALARANVPLVVVNGRLSPRSAAAWGRMPAAARAVFGRLERVLAQSPGDAERFRVAGARRVDMVGNLKFDAPAPPDDPAKRAQLAAAIAGRPVWLAASTHDPEETIVAAAHRRAAAAVPGLLTIIVPRHPARGEAIAADLTAQGLTVVRRAAGAPLGPATDIYLADTLGELGTFYRLAPIAFVGGTLDDSGGHNPIEPAALGAAVLHGPGILNAEESFAALAAAGAARTVRDADELAAVLEHLLVDPAAVAAMAAAGRGVVGASSGALDRTLAALLPYWPGAPAGET